MNELERAKIHAENAYRVAIKQGKYDISRKIATRLDIINRALAERKINER